MATAFAASTVTIVEKPGMNDANGSMAFGPTSNISRPARAAGNAAASAAATTAAAAAATPRSDDEIRVVPLAEYKQAALTLAHAFAKDEVARYFLDVPDRESWSEEHKWNLHLSIMEYIVYATCLKGITTAVGPNYGAVALWMPPGKNMDDMWTIFRSGMWRLQYQLSREGKARYFNEFLPLLHDTKTGVLGERDDDSWYLVYLGTRPEAQGKGYAKRLIKQVTDMADRTGRACYLESSNPRNPPIYRKYGFREKRTVHLQRAHRNVELDIMVRDPMPIGLATATTAASDDSDSDLSRSSSTDSIIAAVDEKRLAASLAPVDVVVV